MLVHGDFPTVGRYCSHSSLGFASGGGELCKLMWLSKLWKKELYSLSNLYLSMMLLIIDIQVLKTFFKC